MIPLTIQFKTFTVLRFAQRAVALPAGYFFFAALIFAQRALAAAEILARPAALMRRLFFRGA